MTLTETAFWTRRLLAALGGLLVLFIVVKVGLRLRHQRQVQTPPPPRVERPTVAFAKLPPLKFSKAISSRPANFGLQTVTGTIPPTPPIGKIFLMPKPAGITFFSLARGKEFAARLGFLGEPEQLSPSQYKWVREVAVPDSGKKARRVLVVDVTSGNFNLSYDFKVDEALRKETLPTEREAVKIVANFLRDLNLYPLDLSGGERRVTYVKLQGGRLTPTVSKTEARFIRVSLFRKGVKDALLGPGVAADLVTPVTPPQFNQAQVQITLSGAAGKERRFVSVNYVFWPVDYENFATYPLRSGQQAFEDLKNGDGAVVSGSPQKAIIRRVSLAYYDPAEHQDFFQPVYIFEGDNNFVAYVPAVEKAWIEGGGSTASQT
jgi:hypothetical protein